MSEQQITTPTQDPLWIAAQQAVATYVASQNVTVIETDDEYAQAGGVLRSIAQQKSDHDAARKRITDPIRAGLDEIMRQAKATVAPLQQLDESIRSEMNDFNARKREAAEAEQAERDRIARQEAEEAAAEEAATFEDETVLETPAVLHRAQERRTVVPAAPPPVKGISKPIQDWKCKVENASLVPREYCMPNESAIRAMVKAQKGNVRIPGVRIWPEDRIAVRKKS